MSVRDVEIVQAMLHELIDLVGEKPALAKRLVESIRFRLSDVSLDPLVVNQREGADSLRKKLAKLSADDLRVVVKQNSIPCQNLPKRKKGELVEVITSYAVNTDVGSTAQL